MKIIDYNNIQNHFDMMVEDATSSKFKLVDKNRKVGNPNDESTIIELDSKAQKGDDLPEKRHDFYCNWIRKTENRVLVKNWFRKKYK